MLIADLDCWGPYRPSVEERLGGCEDYLGRLRRSLAGEIAPDRHYFDDKAHQLRDAVQSLVDHVDDIEWWLGMCAEQMVQEHAEGCTSIADCGRAAGHAGPHREEERCPEQHVLAEVRAASRALRLVTDRLAWGLLTLRAEAGVTDAPTLAGDLRQVQRQLGMALSSLEAVAADASGDEAGR
jgi:hypothetical protein